MLNHRRLENDDFDERGILRDGRVLRVPMRAMDSALPKVRDAGSLHSPDFTSSEQARARKLRAYDAYDAEISARWQSPTTGSHGFNGPVRRHGDSENSKRFLVAMQHPSDGPREEYVEAEDSKAAQLEALRRNPDHTLAGVRELAGSDPPRKKKWQGRNAEGEETGTWELEDHRTKMDQLYQARDADLANAWRRAT